MAGKEIATAPEGESQEELLARAKVRGVNKPFYWLARAILEPPARLYFRFRGIGKAPRLLMNHRATRP